jgi:hypothetical protein
MRVYYTLCAHIRVPSLPLKKDRYKPERNGSPNIPLILVQNLRWLVIVAHKDKLENKNFDEPSCVNRELSHVRG